MRYTDAEVKQHKENFLNHIYSTSVIELFDTIEALQQENTFIKNRNESLKTDGDYWNAEHSKQTERADSLQQENDKLREALKHTLRRCKMIELPQNYELFHAEAEQLIAPT